MHEEKVMMLRYQFDTFGIISHRLPNAIGMWPNEQECLLWCCMNGGTGHWLEVGSFCGGSAVLMCMARRKLNLPPYVISVDVTFNHSNGMFDKNITRGGFNDLSKKILSEGKDIGKHLTEPIGFAFIDGWHSFRSVIQDFEAVEKLLSEDAIVAFHDVSPSMYENNGVATDKHLKLKYDEANANWNDFWSDPNQDFRLDEAIAFLCLTKGYELVNIPVRRKEEHYNETGLTSWVRGKTSPFNSLVAIRKKKNESSSDNIA